MRFTSDTFIIPTFALLSLITPVVGANLNVATFTTPAPGESFMIYDSIYIKWTVTNSQGLDGVNCDIALMFVKQNPSVPDSQGILESGVPILNGESSAPVQIPDVESRDNYFMQLLSHDQNTVYAQSDLFSIT